MTTKPIINQVSNLPSITIHSYERYLPTAFDESMTILQKMNKVINHLNDIGEISNNVVTQWNDLMKWIVDNGLSEIVSDEIDKRIADGTFTTLINNIVGDLTLLETLDKTDMVNAINEVNKIATENNDEIGDISTLNTTNKLNLVDALNEMLVQVLINKQSPTSIGESTGHGTISGLKVRQQTVLAMAVEIGNNTDPNIVHLPNGVRYTPNSIALPVTPSHATLNRKDIVYVNNQGVISYLEGVPSLTPNVPILPNGCVLLAYINVQANDTTVNDVDIEDKRDLKSLTQLLTTNKSNLVQAINEVINSLNDVINNAVGDVANLPTADKTTIVNAIIEVVNESATKLDLGNIVNLPTTDKSSVVNAIIEVVDSLNEVINNAVGDVANLPTADKTTIVNSIIEVVNESATKLDLGNIVNLPTTDKSSVVNAIIEIVNESATKLGNIVNLPTTDKSSIVNAIVELDNDLNNLNDNLDDLIVTPKMFDAIGDGIADDTVAIQNAINYAIANEKTLVFDGDYKFTTVNIESANTLRITRQNGKIVGGKININNSKNIFIDNLVFNYDWVNSGTDVIFAKGSSLKISKCYFTRLADQYPIHFEKCSIDVNECTIFDTTYGIENVSIQGVSTPLTSRNEKVVIRGNTFDLIHGSAINLVSIIGAEGSDLWRTGWDRGNSYFGSVIVEGNTMDNILGYAISFRGWNITFSNNTIKRSDCPTFQGGNVTCVGNYVYESKTIGIDFGNVSQGSITSNVIDAPNFAGIEINACDKVTIGFNTIINPSTQMTSGFASSGIWLHGYYSTTTPARTSKNITVLANVITRSSSGKNVYGIVVEDVDTTATIMGNQMELSTGATEIATNSTKVIVLLNPNQYAYDNLQIHHNGTLTPVTYSGTY